MKVSKVIIDQPENRCIAKASGVINGWFAVHDEVFQEEYQFRVGPILLPHKVLKRPDVEEAMPEHTIVGFQIRFDLSNYLYYIDDGKLVIHVTISDYDPVRLQFTVQESALAACVAEASEV